jgi:hypothetical protein
MRPPLCRSGERIAELGLEARLFADPGLGRACRALKVLSV